MFRLLKEALTAPERSPSPNRRVPRPVRTTEERKLAEEKGRIAREAEEADESIPDLTDDDLMVKDVIEELQRRKTTTQEELELTFKTLNQIIQLLTPTHPPRQALFRKSRGFKALKNILEDLDQTSSTRDLQDPFGQTQLFSGIANLRDGHESRGRRREFIAESPTAETPRAGSNGPAGKFPFKLDLQDKLDVLRLAMKAILIALEDKRNRRWFDDNIGWNSFASIFSQAYKWTNDPQASSSYPAAGRVLGILLSNTLSNDETLPALFLNTTANSLAPFPDMLPISSHLNLSDPKLLAVILDQLPLPYIFTAASKFDKIPDKVQDWPRTGPSSRAHLTMTSELMFLEITLWRVMLVVVQSSWINLFELSKSMGDGGLVECVLDRLYPPRNRRNKQATTTRRPENLRMGIFGGDEDSDYDASHDPFAIQSGPIIPFGRKPKSRARLPAADGQLRLILLKVLRRLVEIGIHPRLNRKVFRLLRKETEGSTISRNRSGDTTPGNSSYNNGTPKPGGTPPSTGVKPRLAKMKPPALKLSLRGLTGDEPESDLLEDDMLDVVRHGMGKRWPDLFAFKNKEAGLDLEGLAKWPSRDKGFYFMAWVYIEQLCAPMTLLHCYDRNKPFMRIRILPNSQVELITTDWTRPDAKRTEPYDVHIFSVPEALVQHQRWVHIAVGGRNPPGSSRNGPGPEIKLVLNGKRCGRPLKCDYPTPPSPGPISLSIGTEKLSREMRSEDDSMFEGLDPSLWYLGPSTLLGEYVGDDLALLLHHLGPRYQGSMQEPLGRFLTYEGATALNIYLSDMAKSIGKDGRVTLPPNSYLIKAIKEGKVFPEEHILFSFSARNTIKVKPSQQNLQERLLNTRLQVLNAAMPAPEKGLELPSMRATLVGDVFAFQPNCLDQALNAIGGPSSGLRLVESSTSPLQLQLSVTILFELLREQWNASEEMERIRGYDILASFLKAKMQELVTPWLAKTLFGFLGVNFDRPELATIINPAGYRSLALRLDVWSRAPSEVIECYCQNFEHLMATSRYRRFNIKRCFRKVAIVRKMMFALKGNIFDSSDIPRIISAVKVILTEHWSAHDSIKPLFAYLISTLCSTPSHHLAVIPLSPPLQAQVPAAALLAAVAEILMEDSYMNKLQEALPLHRVLVIFLTSNPAGYVVDPCLRIMLASLNSNNGKSFGTSFEDEGGFDTLNKTVPNVWTTDIQNLVFEAIQTQLRNGVSTTQSLFPCIVSALEKLLQNAFEEDSATTSGRPTSARGSNQGGLSVSFGSSPSLPSMVRPQEELSTRSALEIILERLNEKLEEGVVYRDLFTKQQLEDLVPCVADFVSMSASIGGMSNIVTNQRHQVERLLRNLHCAPQLSDLLETQIAALLEQLNFGTSQGGPKSLSLSMRSTTSASFRMSASHFSPSTPSQFGSGSPGRLSRRRSSKKSLFSRNIPLMRRLTGDKSTPDKKDKNTTWTQSIIAAESAKFARTTLETKEFWRKTDQQDWPKERVFLNSELGLWPDDRAEDHWRLDGSDGPLRKRMKLEKAIHNPSEKSAAFNPRSYRTAVPREDELSSAVSRIGSAPGDDPFAAEMGEVVQSLSKGTDDVESNVPPQITGDSDDDALVEVEGNESTNRRVSKALRSGDSIEEAYNISRVVGVDGAPGLLIIGKRYLYLIDGLVQLDSGEIVNSHDAPRDMFSIPSGTVAELDADDVQSHSWSFAEIIESNKRSFLFRDVAIEFFFADKRNFLCVFRSQKERRAALRKLSSKNDPNAIKQSALGNLILDTVAKAIDKNSLELEGYTRQWQSRRLSNFAYLQILNQYANRTPNDVTQYPVFPWVLQDYTSDKLNLGSISSFRDLSLPMGALTDARREAATERYQQTALAGEKPFQFGTHFSSSMIVCSYNIRISPYTEMFLALQGGSFDLADRLFSSIPKAWKSASEENRGDVRELIPEFYYSPLFLNNLNHHDFGKKQNSEEGVDAVELPPWALNDPLLFIHRHREALESDYVSRHLPAWIDLIFGAKQHDPESFTCYHPLSYKDAVDLDNISDEAERAASIGIIHNFGMTPEKLFAMPHPQRFIGGMTALPTDKRFGIDEHYVVLIRSALPVAESMSSVGKIIPPINPEAPPTIGRKTQLPHPDGPAYSLHFGFLDQSIRVYFGKVKVTSVAEQCPATAAAFIDSQQLATASAEGVITIWHIRNPIGSTAVAEKSRLTAETTLRGHDDIVTGLVSSSAWSVLVSTSHDGSAIVWDMNRMRFIRRIVVEPEEPIRGATIDDSTGHIALMCDTHVHVYTLNGDLIASATTPGGPQADYSMAGPVSKPTKFQGEIIFLEQEFSKHGPLLAIGLGKDVSLWRVSPGTINEPPWSLREVKRLHGPDNGGYVTAVQFIGEHLYACFTPEAGEGNGKTLMYQWSLPEGGARNVPDNAAQACMADCGRTFGLLEPRRYCGGCGGMFCSNDAVHITGYDLRYCPGCRVVLALAVDVIGGPGSRRGSAAGISSRRSSIQPGGFGSRRGSLAG